MTSIYRLEKRNLGHLKGPPASVVGNGKHKEKSWCYVLMCFQLLKRTSHIARELFCFLWKGGGAIACDWGMGSSESNGTSRGSAKGLEDQLR